MKLNSEDSGFTRNSRHDISIGLISEHADRRYGRRQLANDLPGQLWCDEARAGPVEVETQRVGAGCHCGQSIVDVRDAAYFYLDHDL